MTLSWAREWERTLDRYVDEMVQLRRELHMHPEPSGEEFDTSQQLYTRCLDAGLSVRQGPNGCGVIADLHPANGEDAPIFAIRADIDALRIQDEKDVAYRSRRPNLMHACGHDAHSAVVFGTIKALSELFHRNVVPFPCHVRGIFQPAEETSQGACQMIESGAIDNVSAIIATHVDPARRLGRMGFRKGVFTASCDEMHLTVIGRGGHAARPHEARDPILAAAQLINSLYLQIPRLTDSQDAVVCTIGRVDAGHNANVIPERVELFGTLRTLNQQVRNQTRQLIIDISHAVAAGTQTSVEVEFGESTPPVDNSDALVDLLIQSTEQMIGREAVEMIPRPSMGSEDFSYYGQHIPAAMFRLGIASETCGNSGLHTPLFDVDERSLRLGALIMGFCALSWSERMSQSDQ